MRKHWKKLSLILSSVLLSFSLFACTLQPEDDSTGSTESTVQQEETNNEDANSSNQEEISTKSVSIQLDDIPAYDSSPYVAINNNDPFFTEEDYTTETFETYSDLDSLGRCGTAYANICKELMPTDDREDIGSVTPTGWVQHRYDFVDGGYLYNRSHLIGFQLAGENANPENLIAGTRYMNVEGMLPFENMVDDYVDETGNHVLYRVTPIYEGDNLLASGVLMEAWSVEDSGDGICFCVYCYNVQPGVEIDYATGDNWESGDAGNIGDSGPASETAESTYILNTNTMKFHKPSCSSIEDMSEDNKSEFNGSRDELIQEGYEPCGRCKP